MIAFDRPLHRLRFDPTDAGEIVQFSLRKLVLEPLPPFNGPVLAEAIEPLKVLINLVRLLPAKGGAGGAGRFCLAMLEYLPLQMRVRCAIPPHHAGLMGQFPAVDFVVATADDQANLGKHLAWCDCYIDPLNGLRPTMIGPEIAVIGIVLDLQHMRMPWLFSQRELEARRREYAYAIGRSDHLIAISEYERENLREFYGREDVTVVHLSGFMAEAAAPPPSGGRPGGTAPNGKAAARYLIYPAVPWPHKNHEALIQAVGILRARGKTVPLVLTNASGESDGARRCATLIEQWGLEDLVDRKGFLPESELHSLFQNAEGLVFPSLYEGFGIPIVDAMKMGVPVLAARNSAAKEVGQQACAYFSNIENALTVADDLCAFWEDREGRALWRQRGLERGRDFSSSSMVSATAEAIHAAIAAKRERGKLPPPALERKEPERGDLSVLLLVDQSSAEALARLREAPDIHAFLSQALGTPDVIVALDIALLDDDLLVERLKKVPKLITYNSGLSGSLDFCIQDFDIRYNNARYSLVLSLDGLLKHGAADFRHMRDLLHLNENCQAARFVEGLVQAREPAPLSEIDQVLRYEFERRNHFALVDMMLKRDLLEDRKNGTAALLGYLAIEGRMIDVPSIPR